LPENGHFFDELVISQSNRNVNKIFFCVLFQISTSTALDENAIFCCFCFLQVVQK